jgi:hypothetical protein
MDRITTLYVPQAKLTEYNDLIKSKNNLLDLGIKEFDIIALYSAKFDNGYEARLYIKSGDYESGEVSADMVLFDENEEEVDYETRYEEIDGTWYIYDNGDNYNNCNKYTIMVMGC